MSEQITTYADIRHEIRTLLGWNMQPLTTSEILKSKDALHCPLCKQIRYPMWKAATSDLPFVYTGQYCTCPMQEVKSV